MSNRPTYALPSELELGMKFVLTGKTYEFLELGARVGALGIRLYVRYGGMKRSITVKRKERLEIVR